MKLVCRLALALALSPLKSIQSLTQPKRQLTRRNALFAGAATLSVNPQQAAAEAPPAAGILYDCRRGLSCPATPDFLTALMDRTMLGVGACAKGITQSRGVICVSERHDDFSHHLAQLYTIKSLRKTLRRREGPAASVAVGLEAFQRGHQVYLDRYVSADPAYGLRELLRDVEWKTTWGYDPLLYAPILEDARHTGTRLVGLSPPDALLARVERTALADLDKSTKAFLPENGVSARSELRNAELFGDAAAAKDPKARARLVEVQNFRDEYMSESAALHYDKRRKRDGWLVVLAGERHVANREGVPDRVARRVGRATNTPEHADVVFRGVHTIVPQTVAFPVRAACFPGPDHSDVVWFQPMPDSFNPNKINRAPRPTDTKRA
mmetsp:Transcript_7470/g.22123  ORF Transcript_7470/g.22123 Transcript_7470/m.22123 type:complete len:381 (-) Transcript_7470:46-1188(-)